MSSLWMNVVNSGAEEVWCLVTPRDQGTHLPPSLSLSQGQGPAASYLPVLNFYDHPSQTVSMQSFPFPSSRAMQRP